jgi:hypothetical protein
MIATAWNLLPRDCLPEGTTFNDMALAFRCYGRDSEISCRDHRIPPCVRDDRYTPASGTAEGVTRLFIVGERWITLRLTNPPYALY